MPELVFYEKGHVYMLDGVELPSVSELCRFLTREVYKDAPRWAMEAAAERGTAVHKAAQQLDTAGTCEIEEEYLPYLRAYKAFLKAHKVEWSLIESPMHHPILSYAGTIDRYGLVDGKWTLVELKTSSVLQHVLVMAQTNLYRLMLIENGLPVEQIYALHLKKDGKYRYAPVQISEGLARSLLCLHNTLKKKRRTRNE